MIYFRPQSCAGHSHGRETAQSGIVPESRGRRWFMARMAEGGPERRCCASSAGRPTSSRWRRRSSRAVWTFPQPPTRSSLMKPTSTVWPICISCARRVGRQFRHRAYAYLLLDGNRQVNPQAARRLKAIEEFTELGAGFKIAMRDLEIRGAGNILGTQQSGHIAAVGYEMYCCQLSGGFRPQSEKQPRRSPLEVNVDLPWSAYLRSSANMCSGHGGSIEAYRRLSRVRSVERLGDFRQELRDRFGALPEPAEWLLRLAERALAGGRAGILSECIWRNPPRGISGATTDVVLNYRTTKRVQELAAAERRSAARGGRQGGVLPSEAIGEEKQGKHSTRRCASCWSCLRRVEAAPWKMQPLPQPPPPKRRERGARQEDNPSPPTPSPKRRGGARGRCRRVSHSSTPLAPPLRFWGGVARNLAPPLRFGEGGWGEGLFASISRGWWEFLGCQPPRATARAGFGEWGSEQVEQSGDQDHPRRCSDSLASLLGVARVVAVQPGLVGVSLPGPQRSQSRGRPLRAASSAVSRAWAMAWRTAAAKRRYGSVHARFF